MTTKTRLVAVVDDDPIVLRGLRHLLRSSGYDVDTHDSGRSFLLALSDHEPDCVVLDLHMPDTSGFAVQIQLARRARKIPVVVITADDTPEARVRALSLGATSCLCKPVEKKVLLPAIDAAVNSLTRP
jgi:two-component system, LuxR family, response regulator FixJ